jgi:hypothetical protein
MKHEPHPLSRHSDLAAPVVIHHPEEKETILASWLRRGLAMGALFWVILGAVVAATLAVVVLANMAVSKESPEARAWMELALAHTADQQAKVAEDFPKTKAARWALLEAAGSIYEEGFKQLGISRDVASPFLKRAYSVYEEVYKASEKIDPVVARFAALGMARAAEASGDRARAIEQYKLVATTWPASDEAKQAERLVKRLGTKEAEEFYKWLASYKPPEATLPARGKATFDFPIPGDGGFMQGLVPPPFSAPEPSPSPAGVLPANVFETTPEKDKPPTPEPTAPPAAEPKPATSEPKPAASTPPASNADPKG